MRKFFSDFKAFALRGNVLNLAVGVIIGAAFQAVIASLTENLLSPVLGLIVQQNLEDLTLRFLGVTLKYGAFISSIINFVLIAFVVFLIVRGVGRLERKKPEEAPPAPGTKECPFCLTEINSKATRCPNCTSQLVE